MKSKINHVEMFASLNELNIWLSSQEQYEVIDDDILNH